MLFTMQKPEEKKCDFGKVLKYNIPMMFFLKKYTNLRIPITAVVLFIYSTISKYTYILFLKYFIL